MMLRRRHITVVIGRHVRRHVGRSILLGSRHTQNAVNKNGEENEDLKLHFDYHKIITPDQNDLCRLLLP